jgi:hypothetical protein
MALTVTWAEIAEALDTPWRRGGGKAVLTAAG